MTSDQQPRVPIHLKTEAELREIRDRYREKCADMKIHGQHLYAKIKPTSKYFYQNEIAQKDPEKWGCFPFKVWVGGNDPLGGYLVHGGPGGQYCLSDVNLFIVDEGREIQIS